MHLRSLLRGAGAEDHHRRLAPAEAYDVSEQAIPKGAAVNTVNVEIVRPKRTTEELVVALVVQLVAYLVSGLILMLALGALGWWQPSYREAILVIIAVQAVLPRGGHLAWTKSAAQWRRAKA